MSVFRDVTPVWLALAAVLCALRPVDGQSLSQVPATLSAVPTGATASNPYWQHLVVDLATNPSAGNAIRIELPAGVTVADLDGDGAVEDEISVDGQTGKATGYRSTSGSTAGAIRLVSALGGTVGPVHVQFPIATPSSPDVASAVYGPVTFSNSAEKTVPSGTVTLAFAQPSQLALATPTRLFVDGVADTTTDPQGDRYPETAAAAFSAPLPDLVHDDLGLLTSNALRAAGVPYANGNDGDDVGYHFWLSTTDSLAAVDTTAAVRALDAATGQPARAAEGDSARIAFDVTGLATGTYYLYATSDLTGTFPLVRSRGITVRHQPTVLAVGPAAGPDPDWLDSGLLLDFDRGVVGSAAAARDALTLSVSAVDYDDSASMRLFYAASGSLDTTSVTTTGTAPNRTITGLASGSHVDSTTTLQEGVDSTLTWRVGPNDTTVVAAGDYYLYAVITDGTALAIGRSDTLYHVRHSPFLSLDARADTALRTGGPTPDRFYAITWNQDRGVDGDYDRDDAGGTIALYYSDADTFAVPAGAAALVAAAADTAGDTHRIASGLPVDADGRDDNQYQWDLWRYANPDDGGVPREGRGYYLYGVIAASSTQRLVRWEDGAGAARSLRFVHDPHVTIAAPLAAVAVEGRRSFDVAWEAVDVDDAASIWVVLLPAVTSLGLPAQTTWSQLAAAGRAWNATSADGSLALGQPLSESTASFAVRPARLRVDLFGAANPIVDGEYSVWVVIDPAAGPTPATDSPAQRAPGQVAIDGLGAGGAAGLAGPALEVLPARVTIAAWRDTATFSLRPHTQGESVDVVSAFLSVDTLLASVVDQDSTRAGTQPFAVNPALGGLTLFDSVRVGSDTTVAGLWVMDLVYFDQDGMTFDGDTELATVRLAAKGREGTATLRVNHLEPRRTAFYRHGAVVGAVAPESAALLSIRPRATVSGHVRLQGRTEHSERVTFELRQRNGFTPVSDSLFLAVNDVSSATPGLQDSLGADGAFSLTQVPSGTWHLVAHVDRYLDGQWPNLRADPGAVLTEIDPTFRAAGGLQDEFLRGGDVTGWSDTTGVSSPDNEVDQLDIDFITSYFGETTTPAHAATLADVDGDSLVWVPDLNMVAANYGVTGVEPSYRPAGADPRADAAPVRLTLAVERVGSGRLAVAVRGDALPEMRAYGVTLTYDPTRLRPVAHDTQGPFGARPAIAAYREEAAAFHGAVHLGRALLGPGTAPAARLVRLVEVVFEPVQPGIPPDASAIHLAAAGLVDGRNQARQVHAPAPVLPRSFALGPNYPNPFNPATALRLDLPVATALDLAVYDAAGQRVRTLVAGPLAAGLHTVPWDGRDDEGRPVGSGAYFARLFAPSFRAERKMLLLR